MTPPTSTAQRLFLLDGHSLAYRAFFALPQTLATSTGQITNAVYGFTSMLIKLLAEEQPDLIAVSFDVGAPTVRLEKYPEYKAGRAETPDEFRQQLGLILEVLETLAIPTCSASRATRPTTRSGRSRCAAREPGDRRDDRDRGPRLLPARPPRDHRDVQPKGISDIRQLRRGGGDRAVRPAAASSTWTTWPSRATPSDNIPGVPGWGRRRPPSSCKEFGSIEELLAHTDELKGKLKENDRGGGRAARAEQGARPASRPDLDLDVEPEDCVMGEWDVGARPAAVRLARVPHAARAPRGGRRSAGAAAEVAELDLREGKAADVGRSSPARSPSAVRIDVDGRASARHRRLDRRGAGRVRAGEAARACRQRRSRIRRSPKWFHDAKECETDVLRDGRLARGRRVRHDARRLPARSRAGLVPAPRAVRALPGHGRAR